MQIWVNPRCSKCRLAQEALDDAGASYERRLYLEQPPTAEELRDVLSRLGLEPWEICRTGDAERVGATLPPAATMRSASSGSRRSSPIRR